MGRTDGLHGQGRALRTIPTHVGRTSIRSRCDSTNTDHPHARGENSRSTRRFRSPCGPSPRTWGEPDHAGGEHTDRRTIPTHVGRTARFAGGFVPSRTIPTHVGRTISRYPPCHPHADHPHARGENALVNVPTVNYRGPSPRTWGERDDRVTVNRRHRTIPTHVGRTAETVVVVRSRADHPHARGENRVALAPRRLPADHPHARGENRPRSELRHGSTDHPHAHGENIRREADGMGYSGPSPRTWGEQP